MRYELKIAKSITQKIPLVTRTYLKKYVESMKFGNRWAQKMFKKKLYKKELKNPSCSILSHL